jgi:hypothetical protein
MAKDFENLNPIDTNPTEGKPIPFSIQSLFDGLKSSQFPSQPKNSVALPNGGFASTPDELKTFLSVDKNTKDFWSQYANDDKFKQFAITSEKDLSNVVKGGISKYNQSSVWTPSAQSLHKIPAFGQPGFEAAFENRDALNKIQESANNAFLDLAKNGLNYTLDGQELTTPEEASSYFLSSPETANQWTLANAKKLADKKINGADIFERLKEKPSVVPSVVQDAASEDRFFGNLDNEKLGEILDNAVIGEGENVLQLDENAGFYFTGEVGPDGVTPIENKLDKIDINTVSEYLTSQGMSPEDALAWINDKREVYRDAKYSKIDKENNDKSEKNTFTMGGLRIANQYQADMDAEAFGLLDKSAQAIAKELTTLDGLYQDRKAISEKLKTAPFDQKNRQALQQTEASIADIKTRVAEMKSSAGMSNFTVYDPETRTVVPQQQVQQAVAKSEQKYNKAYYDNTQLGQMIQERNKLLLQVKDLRNTIERKALRVAQNRQTLKAQNEQASPFDQTFNAGQYDPSIERLKEYYLQKAADLGVLNKAIYTNDNPLKRNSTGFFGGVSQYLNEGKKPILSKLENVNGLLPRQEEARIFAEYMQKNGQYVSEKDLESTQMTVFETVGYGALPTLQGIAEIAAYTLAGNEAMSAVTAGRYYTLAKEFVTNKYGKLGLKTFEFLTGAATKTTIQVSAAVATGQQGVSGALGEQLGEKVFEKQVLDKVPLEKLLKGKNKYLFIVGKYLSGVTASTVGEVSGNLADLYSQAGYDLKTAFDLSTEPGQLASIVFTSALFGAPGDIDLLFKNKEKLAKYFFEQKGKEIDPLLIEMDNNLDQAIAVATAQDKTQKPKGYQDTNTPIETQVSEAPVENAEVSDEKVQATKQEEKLEVENRIADPGEEFHVVEKDGTVNKDVTYRYNEQTNKLESKGYSEWNKDWQETNDVLEKAVNEKVSEYGMLSRDKAMEISKKNLDINDNTELIWKDGKLLYSNDTYNAKSAQRVKSIKETATDQFSDKKKKKREQIKKNIFDDVEEVKSDDPEYNAANLIYQSAFGKKMRLNKASVFFKGAKLIPDLYNGLTRVSDYLAPLIDRFTKIAENAPIFSTVLDNVLNSKYFTESIGEDNVNTDFAKTFISDLLLNDDALIANVFENDSKKISDFKLLREKLNQNISREYIGRSMMSNQSSFYNNRIGETKKTVSTAETRLAAKEYAAVEEDKRQVAGLVSYATGEKIGDDQVAAIRYKQGKIDAKDFLETIGENTDSKSDDELIQSADEISDKLFDYEQFKGWDETRKSFISGRKERIKEIKTKLKSTFDYKLYGNPSGILETIGAAVDKITNRKLRAQYTGSAKIFNTLLEFAAMRDGKTPEEILNNEIEFQRIEQAALDAMIANNPQLEVLKQNILTAEKAVNIPGIKDNMIKAIEDEKRGLDPKTIYFARGWFRDENGQWLYRANPQGVTIDKTILNRVLNLKIGNGTTINIAEFMEYPELFEAYPDFKNIQISFVSEPDSKLGGQALFDEKYAEGSENNSPGTIKIYIADVDNELSIKSMIAHELQHFVQEQENLPRGGAPIKTYVTKSGAKKYVEITQKEFIDYNNKNKEKTTENINSLIDILDVAGDFENPNVSNVLKQIQNLIQENAAFPFTAAELELKYGKLSPDQVANLMSTLNSITSNRDDLMFHNAFLDAANKKLLPGEVYNNFYGEIEANAAMRIDSYRSLLQKFEAAKGALSPADLALFEDHINKANEYVNQGVGVGKKIEAIIDDLLQRSDVTDLTKQKLQELKVQTENYDIASPITSSKLFLDLFASIDDKYKPVLEEIYFSENEVSSNAQKEFSEISKFIRLDDVPDYMASAEQRVFIDEKGAMRLAGELSPSLLTQKQFDEAQSKARTALNEETGKILNQDQRGTTRAAVLITDSKNIIFAVTDPNVSSPLHEMAHIVEKYLTAEERQTVLDFSGQTEWNVAASEAFARGFEKFLYDGQSPNNEMLAVFAKFKNWLADIYAALGMANLGKELNPEMKNIYNTIFGETKTKQEETNVNTEEAELAQFIEDQRNSGKEDSEIYSGLRAAGFSPYDLTDFFEGRTKQTVYNQIANTGDFEEDARAIEEDQITIRRELGQVENILDQMSKDELDGMLFALEGASENIDVKVIAALRDIIAKKKAGGSVTDELSKLAMVGTNIGRALQRFKMLNKNTADYTLARIIKDLNTKGNRIPPRVLNDLADMAKDVDAKKQAMENARTEASVSFIQRSKYDPSLTNYEYFQKARKEYKDANFEYFKKLKPFARTASSSDTYATMLRGNLLTSGSFLLNTSASAVKGVVNIPVNFLATGYDIAINNVFSRIGDKKIERTTYRGYGYYMTLLRSLGAAASEAKTAFKYGSVVEDASGMQVERGFNGLKAFTETLGLFYDIKNKNLTQEELAEKHNLPLNEKNMLSKKAIIVKAMEGMFGSVAELNFRALGGPDAFFRTTAYYGALYEQAKTMGFDNKPNANFGGKSKIDMFIDLNSDYTNIPAYEEAKKFIYANDSALYKGMRRMFSSSNKIDDSYLSKAGKAAMTTLIPYQKIPTNVAHELLQYSVPEIAIFELVYNYNKIAQVNSEIKNPRVSSKNKNKLIQERKTYAREINLSLARATIGTGLKFMAGIFADTYALSGSSAPTAGVDERERLYKSALRPSNHLNISLFLRNYNLPEGSNPSREWLEGDLKIPMMALGIAGSIFAAKGTEFEKENRESYNEALNKYENKYGIFDNFLNIAPVFLEQPFIKNMGSFFESLNSLSGDSQKIETFFINYMTSGITAFLPNHLNTLSRINREYKPNFYVPSREGESPMMTRLMDRLKEKAPWMELEPSLRDVTGKKVYQTPTDRNKILYNTLDPMFKATRNFGNQHTINQLVVDRVKPTWKDLIAMSVAYGDVMEAIPNTEPKTIKSIDGKTFILSEEQKEVYADVLYTIREYYVNQTINDVDLYKLIDVYGEYNYNRETKLPIRDKGGKLLGYQVLGNLLKTIYDVADNVVKNSMGPKMIAENFNELPEEVRKAIKEKNKENIYGEVFDEFYLNKPLVDELNKVGVDLRNELVREMNR